MHEQRTLSLTRRRRRASRWAALAVLVLGVVALGTSPVAHAGVTSVDDGVQGSGPNQFNYTGTWTHCSSGCQSGLYNNTQSWTNSSGGSVSLVFTGTQIQLYGLTNNGSGKGNVQICDQNVANCSTATSVDWYTPTEIGNNLIYTSPTLSSGTHSILMSWTGTKNASSSATYVNVDRVAIIGGTGTTLMGTYYIDNASGSGCSNANSGTSTGSPWCDFSNLNGQTFGAGAQILLRRGDTFNQELGRLYGGGTSSSYATIGAYGSGARPIITRNSSASDRVLWVQNGDYWNVQHLEIENAGMGIVFWYDTLGHQGLNFSDLYIHDIVGYYAVYQSPPSDLPGLYDSVGLYISGNPTQPTSSQWVVKNIAMTDITATADVDTVDISGMGGFLDTWPNTTVQNVTIDNANWHDNWGCPNFDNISNVIIRGSSIQANAQAFSPQNNFGTTNLFWWVASHFTVTGSILGNVPDTGVSDETATDFEAYDDHGSYLGNWIGGNAGKGLEFLQLGRPSDYNNNHLVSDNAFTGNGSLGGFGPGDIESYTSAVQATAQNNLYSDSPFITGTTSGWTQTGNTSVLASDISNAGVGFAGTQGTNNWSYQYWNGSTTLNLTYNGTSGLWGSANGFVNALTMLPINNASQWISRTWIAPRAGTVEVRGWLTKEQQGGDGIQYGMTVNGVWQSGFPATLAASNVSGVATELSVTVAQGDAIQFQVNAGSAGDTTADIVSWNPTVAYH
jgi:hypothetical protein